MAGWKDVNLREVTTGFDIVPEGEYTFTLLPGAKRSQFDNERIEAQITVTGGEQNGRRLFISYPNPAAPNCDWSPKALKRLSDVVGIEPEDSEHPVEFLNRIAGSKFTAPVNHVTIVTDAGERKKERINLFKVGVAQ